jgi:hypothetical protein
MQPGAHCCRCYAHHQIQGFRMLGAPALPPSELEPQQSQSSQLWSSLRDYAQRQHHGRVERPVLPAFAAVTWVGFSG